MPPYQNYFNNPYYGQYQQPQMPQMPQNTNPTSLSGRMINDASEITVNDVAMNGRFSIFPKVDMSEILCKTWLPNGTIQTISFKPCLEPREATFDNQTNNYSIEELKSAVGSLNERVGQIEESLKPRKGKNNE